MVPVRPLPVLVAGRWVGREPGNEAGELGLLVIQDGDQLAVGGLVDADEGSALDQLP